MIFLAINTLYFIKTYLKKKNFFIFVCYILFTSSTKSSQGKLHNKKGVHQIVPLYTIGQKNTIEIDKTTDLFFLE